MLPKFSDSIIIICPSPFSFKKKNQTNKQKTTKTTNNNNKINKQKQIRANI
jgi:hypothetical protein